eukprot:385938-Pyramimonas_sp.AAC.1
MEALKELDDVNLSKLVELLNEWWRSEAVPADVAKARVALIFKKGDASKLDNDRPISLLNSVYKLYAAILQKRIEECVDPYVQTTQYGFRRRESTMHAVQCVRRFAEMGEAADQQVLMVLLDWEKAFDKVTLESLWNAMDRMNVHPKLIKAVQSIYRVT